MSDIHLNGGSIAPTDMDLKKYRKIQNWGYLYKVNQVLFFIRVENHCKEQSERTLKVYLFLLLLYFM